MARVLVVDDDEVTRTLLDARLVAAGHWVRLAASLPEARAVIRRSGPPDVLVTDMFMPGGSGLRLVTDVRADPECADVPVILLSGRALPGDVEAGRALGATYLSKPVSAADLVQAVDTAAESSPSALDAAVREHLGDPRHASAEEAAERAERLTAFVAQAPEALSGITDAARAADGPALAAAAHRLGEAARRLGAVPLARLCADLEDRARAQECPEPPVISALVEQEVSRTCTVFRTLADRYAGVQSGPVSRT